MRKILALAIILATMVGCAQERSGVYSRTLATLDTSVYSRNAWEITTFDYVLSIEQKGREAQAELSLETNEGSIAFETASAEISPEGGLILEFSHTQDLGFFGSNSYGIALREVDSSETDIVFQIEEGRELFSSEPQIETVSFTLDSETSRDARREQAVDEILVNATTRLENQIDDEDFESAQGFMNLILEYEHPITPELENRYVELQAKYEEERARKAQEYRDTLFGRRHLERGWR